MTQATELKAAFTAVQNAFQKGLEATGSEEAITSMNQGFDTIYNAIDADEDHLYAAQDTMSHLMTMHPNLAHAIPRILLWRLGGTCLHFLADEEIEAFSAQNELH